MSLLPVADALARLLDRVTSLPAEKVPLAGAAGRVLAAPVAARRTHPPFAASAMDGYAVQASDVRNPPARLRVIGAAPAGHDFKSKIGPGECARIFTGAPVPPGADAVLIQENTEKLPGEECLIIAHASLEPGRNIRLAGQDFVEGQQLLDIGRRLDAAALSLAAAANYAQLDVVRRPRVAILATGDELVPPGSQPGPSQIIASNSYGIAALVTEAGGEAIDLGIVPDRMAAIATAIQDAVRDGADILVTLGGASVGDHDLVGRVLDELGMQTLFRKVAMRPGKPVMAGKLEGARIVGLPGNPVSAMVAAEIFLKPLVKRLSGQASRQDLREARLAAGMAANGDRQDFVRASVSAAAGGALLARPFIQQDSSMLRVLAESNALIVRQPNAGPANEGDVCLVMMLRDPE